MKLLNINLTRIKMKVNQRNTMNFKYKTSVFMRKFLLSSALIITLNSYSQDYKKTTKEGVIYLSSGEKLEGYVKLSWVYAGVQRKKPKVFLWKSKNKGKRKTFKAVEVDSILIHNEKTIYSLPVNKACKKMFFTICHDAKVPLVIFNMKVANTPNMSSQVSTEYWIWKKNLNKAFPLKTHFSSTKSFKRHIKEGLYECEKITSEFTPKELRKMDVIELVKYYNKCIE